MSYPVKQIRTPDPSMTLSFAAPLMQEPEVCVARLRVAIHIQCEKEVKEQESVGGGAAWEPVLHRTTST